MFDYIKFDHGSFRLLLCIVIIGIVWSLFNLKKQTSIIFNVVMGYVFAGFLSAFLFYSLSQYQWYSFDQSEIQYAPLLFLVLLFIVMSMPFLYLNPAKITKIDDRGIDGYLNLIAILLAVLSIFPFLNGLIGLFSLNYDSIVSSYEGKGLQNIENPLVYYSNQIRNYFKFFISPLLFYYLYMGQRFKRYFYCVVFALFTTVLLSLVGGGRGTMVNEVNYVIISYLLFASVLPDKVKHKVKKMGAALLVMVALSLTIITFARSNFSSKNATKDQKLDLITWVSLYLGQGPLEFSRQMYPSTVRTEGDNSFSLVKTILGEKTFKDNDERRDYWEKKQTIQNFIFYTVIGDLYSDLGFTYTILFLVLISIGMCFYFKKFSQSKIPIHTIVIASIYFEWITMGFMTNCYKTYYSQFFILVTIMILVYLSLARNKQFGGGQLNTCNPF